MNSIELINRDTNNFFDIIWVDGHHGNPYATIDIMNSLRLIKDDGLIICDDVLISEYISAYDRIILMQPILLNALKNNFIKYWFNL